MKNQYHSVIDLVLLDHRHLKKSIEVILNPASQLGDQLSEARAFLNLLKKHSLAEDKTIYTDLENEDEFRPEILEAKVEHQILDQKVRGISSKILRAHFLTDEVMAELRVLAEWVNRHIREEEKELLPRMKKDLSELYLADLGVRYARVRKYSPEELDEISVRNAAYPPRAMPYQNVVRS